MKKVIVGKRHIAVSDSEAVLRAIQSEGIFTRGETFEGFLTGLRRRYEVVFGEELDIHDYDRTVEQLIAKNLVQVT